MYCSRPYPPPGGKELRDVLQPGKLWKSKEFIMIYCYANFERNRMQAFRQRKLPKGRGVELLHAVDILRARIQGEIFSIIEDSTNKLL